MFFSFLGETQLTKLKHYWLFKDSELGLKKQNNKKQFEQVESDVGRVRKTESPGLKVNFDVAERSLLSLKRPWAPNPAVINRVDTVGAGMEPRSAA